MGRHALVLGTATYHGDPKLSALPGVRQDVEQLRTVLDTDGDFDSVVSHLDLPAAHMKRVVEEFYGSRRTGDLALFYYSGHGIQHDDRQSLFFGTIDTDTTLLHTTAFDVEGVLRHLLNHTKASQKVVLLDCCFSGSFTARHRFSGGVRQEPRRLKRERGTFMLQSSSHLKASKAQGPDRPSAFTEALLAGLRGEAQATAEDGWITASDLSRYAMTEMARRRQEKPVESSEGVTDQIPLVAGQGERPQRKLSAGTEEPDDAPFDADRWRRLVGYYIDCLQRSAVLQFFVNPGDKNSYLAVPKGREIMLSATEPIMLKDRGVQLAKLAKDGGRCLQYGYPIVAIEVAKREVRLAPLLVCDLTVGDDGLAHPAPPQPSPALIDHFQLAAVEADELRHAVAGQLDPGDRGSLTRAVNLIANAFGLKAVSILDPEDLTGAVKQGPINRVQNAGMLFAAGSKESPERQLIEDLREITKNAGKIASTALGALSNGAEGGADAQGTDVLTVALNSVNETQEEIIRAAMSRRLTVAQGPPGTGKSQLVTTLLATATAAGQSVLIGSTNNRAVDEVVERITRTPGPGLVLRTGNKEYRQREPQYLAEVMQAWPPPVPDAHGPFHELRLVAQEINRLRDDLDQRRRLERDLTDLALERDSALADIDASSLTKLVDLTDRALRSRWFGWWYRRRLRSRGVFDRKAITVLGEQAVIEQCWRERRQELASRRGTAEQAWMQLQNLQQESRPEHSAQLLRAQIAARVASSMTLLRNRADEMAKPDAKSWSYMTELVATALPGWAVTAMSARRVLPKAGLFDLVIIDEAAQCTVAAILPMLYRAKRALIIGDPRQLAPVVGLSDADDRSEQARAGLGHEWLTNRRLTYRNHSAYEAFATAAASSILLDEHYRCHPEIIDIPNRVVYQNRLTVLTHPDRLVASAEPATRWVDVPGRFSPGATGSGHNLDEAKAVVGEAQRLRTEYPNVSIGVVTPLAEQQRTLERALRNAGLGDDLLCATIHKFQGSEKDIMVISPVGAQGISERTRGWLVNQTNLWNVAITRAKSQLIIVGDRSWWSGQRGLLAAFAVPPAPVVVGDGGHPRPVDRLIPGLRGAGLTVKWGTPLPGYPVDLTLSLGDKSLAVLVDDPEGDPDGRPLRRILERLDIVAAATEVRRVSAWRCLAEPEQVVSELCEALRPTGS